MSEQRINGKKISEYKYHVRCPSCGRWCVADIDVFECQCWYIWDFIKYEDGIIPEEDLQIYSPLQYRDIGGKDAD